MEAITVALGFQSSDRRPQSALLTMEIAVSPSFLLATGRTFPFSSSIRPAA